MSSTPLLHFKWKFQAAAKCCWPNAIFTCNRNDIYATRATKAQTEPISTLHEKGVANKTLHPIFMFKNSNFIYTLYLLLHIHILNIRKCVTNFFECLVGVVQLLSGSSHLLHSSTANWHWLTTPPQQHPPTHYAHPKSQLHLSSPSHVCVWVCCIWSLGSKVSMRAPPRFSCPIVSCGNINIAATVARTRGTDTRQWSIERWKYFWEFRIWTFATRKLYFRPEILRFWGIIQDQRLPKIYVCI